ncbi:hypothetical protein GC167_04150 [bacterium]|nr:hypothetical protein [bacterium]
MNATLRNALTAVLAVVAIALAYWLFRIINHPIAYERVKGFRYQMVQQRLEQIRDAQLAYKQELGSFAGDFNTLIAFVDTGKISIVERKDSSFQYYNKIFQQEMIKDTVVVRVLGSKPVKTSLFTEDFKTESLRYIPFPEGSQNEFTMAASTIERNDLKLPVFEVSAANTDIFADVADRYKDLIKPDYKLVLGSLTEPSTSGNWK